MATLAGFHHAIAELRRAALEALRPPPRLALSEWIERNLVLPAGTTALPGRMRLWPPQRGIADAIGDPAIERVTIVKPVRVGYTSLVVGVIGHHVANEPAPILALLPTEPDARDFIVSDVEPVFEATPSLQGTLTEDPEDVGHNTLLHRIFAGGSLKCVAARAPRNLRRHSARLLVVDEADAMERGPEGNPIRLAERRTLSFANRKIVIGSTPLFEDTSHVLRAYGTSDQRVFECPCPACGTFVEIMWAHIEWQPDRPETAAFRCPSCKALIDERLKPEMVQAGRWRATRPDVVDHAGFRLNALVSLLANASWGKLAKEFLAAKDDPSELQTFINTILAEGWNGMGEEVEEQTLAARAEPFGLDRIPAEVLVITVGVDVQDDRLECVICGWTRQSVCLVLGHVVLWGAYDDDTTWIELDELLKTRWTHPHGGRLRVDAACVDAGDGQHYDKVVSFCLSRAGRRVMAVKGASGTRPAIKTSGWKVKAGGRLWIVGVDGLKANILDKIQRSHDHPERVMIRFSEDLEPVFYEQLASERRVVRYRAGQPVRRFERIPGRRAEALDATVYAFAARSAAPVQLDQREAELRSPVPPAPKRPAVIRSEFMSR